MRGKPIKPITGAVIYRITPACAGKTCGFSAFIDKSEDHPRVCGENATNASDIMPARGSPPRVRGKRLTHPALSSHKRITPACAGKTTIWEDNYKGFKDHPRVCGENLVILIPRHCKIGSPPRVRGKHFGNGVFPWLILVLSLNPL